MSSLAQVSQNIRDLALTLERESIEFSKTTDSAACDLFIEKTENLRKHFQTIAGENWGKADAIQNQLFTPEHNYTIIEECDTKFEALCKLSILKLRGHLTKKPPTAKSIANCLFGITIPFMKLARSIDLAYLEELCTELINRCSQETRSFTKGKVKATPNLMRSIEKIENEFSYIRNMLESVKIPKDNLLLERHDETVHEMKALLEKTESQVTTLEALRSKLLTKPCYEGAIENATAYRRKATSK
jgi:hypothetical protein